MFEFYLLISGILLVVGILAAILFIRLRNKRRHTIKGVKNEGDDEFVDKTLRHLN